MSIGIINPATVGLYLLLELDELFVVAFVNEYE